MTLHPPIFATLVLCCACTEYQIEAPKVDPPGDTGEPAVLAWLEVDPLELDFGAIAPGDEATMTVSVSNTGGSDLEILDLALLDPSVPFTVQDLGATLLGGGETTTFAVTYRPVDLGSFEGWAEVSSDAPGSGLASVHLLGETLWPSLTILPELHDFGDVEVGDADYVDVVVINEGESAAVLGALRFTSTSDSELLLHDEGDLASLPLRLEPWENASARVRFAPADEGVEEASFMVESDDPSAPELLCDITGNGVEGPDEPEEIEYAVELRVTADDAYQAWIDGSEVTGGSSSTWSSYDTASATLVSGDHTIAVYATDMYSVISGMIATVEVDGATWSITGDGSWLHTTSNPGTGWEDPAFSDASWTAPVPCADTSSWGSSPADLLADGAQWVWWSSNCRSLGEAWFRLNMTLP